jgi:hypothetical protein
MNHDARRQSKHLPEVLEMAAAEEPAANHCNVDAAVALLRNVSATLRTAKVRLEFPIACFRPLQGVRLVFTTIRIHQSQHETLLIGARINRDKDIAVVCISLREARAAVAPDWAGLPAAAARALELHYVRFADALLEQVPPAGSQDMWADRWERAAMGAQVLPDWVPCMTDRERRECFDDCLFADVLPSPFVLVALWRVLRGSPVPAEIAGRLGRLLQARHV